MWRLYQQSSTFGQLPNVILGVADPWAAWQLNNAVARFGIMVQNKLDDHDRFDAEYKPAYTLGEVLQEAHDLMHGITKPLKARSDFDGLMAFGQAMGLRIQGEH
mgnify:CR=1 FL=1|jgi:hypothetical protein